MTLRFVGSGSILFPVFCGQGQCVVCQRVRRVHLLLLRGLLGTALLGAFWVLLGVLCTWGCTSFAGIRDWVRKGSYHTAWAVPCDSLCTCSYSYGRGPAVGPHTGQRCWPLLEGVWRAIAPLMKPWCAEGEVPTAANLNLYRGWNSCVGWHCDDEPLFGKCGDAKLIVSVSLGNFSGGDVSPVRPMKIARAGLTMVTFLSWMVNARTSSFIGRTLAGNRIGLTLRSVGSNSICFLLSFV